MTAIARFLAKVDRTEGCWLWTAAHVPKGYGVFYFGGRQQYAHRVSYQLHVGDIPEGMLILHCCDNPRCVNPRHLRLGSAKENTADMLAKGRHRTNPATGDRNVARKRPEIRQGENNGQSRLTAEQVRLIREEYASGALQREIGARYGIKQAQVSSIVRGASWAHSFS